MTKESALYTFFSSFGLAAYEENAVPTGEDAPKFPYITYEVITGSLLSGQILLSASLWYRGSSWKECNAKTAQIASSLGMGGVFLDCDGGAIWVQAGVPFAQSMGDPDDNMIKRKILNLTVEYWTEQ